MKKNSSSERAQDVVDGVVSRLAETYKEGVPLLSQPSDDPALDREFEAEMRRASAILNGWPAGVPEGEADNRG